MRLALLALAALGSASAQATPITLSDALVRAEERSPALQEATARQAEARAQAEAAGYLVPANPELELRFEGTGLPGSAEESRLELALTQEIELFGQRGLRRRMAGADHAALTRDVVAVRLRLRAEVAGAYHDLMLQERLAGVMAGVVEQAARLAEATQRRLVAGDLPEIEAALVAIDQTQVHAEADQAAAELATARARLNRLVGQSPAAPLVTQGDFAVAAAPAELAVLLARARDLRPELAASAHELRARKLEITLRRRERWPNPVLWLGYARERTTLAGAGEIDHVIGLGLSFTLPLMRTGRAEIAEARARQGAAEARRAALAAQVDEEVAGARARYLAARSQVARYADLAPRLAELNALYERGLAAGEIDLTAFLAARDRMLRTSAAALAARRDAAVAAAALEAAVGGDFRGTAR